MFLVVNKNSLFWNNEKQIWTEKNNASNFKSKLQAIKIAEKKDAFVVHKDDSMEMIQHRIQKNFFLAFGWLDQHKKMYDAKNEEEVMDRQLLFGNFMTNGIYIMPVIVDQKHFAVEDWKQKNTQTEVWLEAGPLQKDQIDPNNLRWSHDIRLDCGGKTFEEAISKLAKLVAIYYGYYKNEEFPW